MGNYAAKIEVVAGQETTIILIKAPDGLVGISGSFAGSHVEPTFTTPLY